MTVEKEKNGKLSFVNAGHCLAAMCKKDGVFTIQKDKHSMIAGALDRAVFVINEMKLDAGDTIYLYTDGIIYYLLFREPYHVNTAYPMQPAPIVCRVFHSCNKGQGRFLREEETFPKPQYTLVLIKRSGLS